MDQQQHRGIGSIRRNVGNGDPAGRRCNFTVAVEPDGDHSVVSMGARSTERAQTFSVLPCGPSHDLHRKFGHAACFASFRFVNGPRTPKTAPQELPDSAATDETDS